MKKVLLFAIILISIVVIGCTEEEEIPFICHLYGYIRDNDTQLGVDGMIIQIVELINPYDINSNRIRYDTTMTQDSIPGFFEMDSVCYGTNKRQGTGMVIIGIDSTLNPGWLQGSYPIDVTGSVDTVYVYILRAN
ncbi:MAG: hypothetical protein OEV79_02020 [candidate division WOR-3 bacterium]|nr:hypothetical protein [candidate division WOR-3 bacterium]